MKYEHYCHEWDGMKIDESMPEFGVCICFDDQDAEKFREMHQKYHDSINELTAAVWSDTHPEAMPGNAHV